MIIKMASTSNLRVPKADYTQIPTSAFSDPYRSEVTHIAALRFRGWRPPPASWRLRRSDGTRGKSAASAAEDGGGARRGRENRRCAALMAHGDGWMRDAGADAGRALEDADAAADAAAGGCSGILLMMMLLMGHRSVRHRGEPSAVSARTPRLIQVHHQL